VFVRHYAWVSDSLAGRLLIASLSLTDPNFFRTVILMCMHDANGAMGLVLNRPLGEEQVIGHLPQFAKYAGDPPVVFSGGPVEPSGALVLARYKERLITPTPNPVVGRVGLVDLSRPVEELEGAVDEVRVFAGYAGWGEGQLEREIEEDAWFVVDAAAEDVFSAAPEGLWREILRRQRGRLAMFAYAPPDPSVN
jgi:putative transcriptional regulator